MFQRFKTLRRKVKTFYGLKFGFANFRLFNTPFYFPSNRQISIFSLETDIFCLFFQLVVSNGKTDKEEELQAS